MTRGLFTFLQVHVAREAEREQRLAPLTGDQASGTIAVQADGREVKDVRRREFAGMLGVGAAALAVEGLTSALNPDLATALEVTSRSRGSVVATSDIERLALLADDFKRAFSTADPPALYRDLLTTRINVAALLHRRPTLKQQRDLLVVAGWLSALLGLACFDLGRYSAVTVWCEDAITCAEQAGNAEIAAWAHEPTVVMAFYLGQPETAARRAQAGQALVREGSTVWAVLAAQEMRALARAGDEDGYQQARSRAEKAVAKLAVAARGYTFQAVNSMTMPFFTASSLVMLGRYREAEHLAHWLLEQVPPDASPTGHSLYRIEHGLALAGLGQLDGAAADGMAALDSPRLVASVLARAGELDAALQRRFPGSAEARDFHERYRTARRSLEPQRG